jgi:hypothetical protein
MKMEKQYEAERSNAVLAVKKSNRARALYRSAGMVLLGCLLAAPGFAETPPVSVTYQPMVSDGLAAGHPHESWFVFDNWSNPNVPGFAVPAEASVKFTFPQEFTPEKGHPLGAVMLYGWTQKPIPVKFVAKEDATNPRVVIVQFEQPISVGASDKPGLKALHLRTGILNPAKPGNYPIRVEFVNAGSLTGSTTAVAAITAKPIPNIASYNSLHESRNENWQHLKSGQEAPLPLDFLVTIPDLPRSFVSLRANVDGSLSILSDGAPIGSVVAQGVPVSLRPEPFGPGQARVGIIRVHVKGGAIPGMATIVASLDGGTKYTINAVVE